MKSSYTKKQKGRYKTRQTRQTRKYRGGVHIYDTEHISKIESDNEFDLFKLNIIDAIDTVGCHGLKKAETYWKECINTKYTVNKLLTLLLTEKVKPLNLEEDPNTQIQEFYGINPLIKEGLERIPDKNIELSYRDTFLAKHPELLENDEIPGIHIICLDDYGYKTLQQRHRHNMGSVPKIIVNNLMTNQKKFLVVMLYLEAVPGLNLVLSCSQSEIINILNDDKTNTEKGPAKGYYYMGFDRNIYYYNNTIVMAASNAYYNIPTTDISYNLGNTNITYLNKINSGIRSRIQTIFEHGAVVFTTENIKKKFGKMVAHISTANYRTSQERKKRIQPILPKDTGIFKLEDGTPHEISLFSNPNTNPTKNQYIGPLSSNMNLQVLIQRKIKNIEILETKAKQNYITYASQRPDLAKHIDNDPRFPSYKSKLNRIDKISRWNKNTIKKELVYEQNYVDFINKHDDEIGKLHPSIWDYITFLEDTSGSHLAIIKTIISLLKTPSDAKVRIDSWLTK